jgi:dCMP deaminase
MLMDMARVVSARGTCMRMMVGAIIARDSRALSMGYNGVPSGLPHCNHTMDEANGCARAVHAEANAIVWAARNGIVTDGAEMFTTHMPCLSCAALIINAGIMRLVWSIPYRDRSGMDLLVASGRVELEQLK